MAEFAVQKGIFDALSGLGLTVYDVQPQAPDGGSNANFPCVTVGTIVFAPFDVKESTGFDFIARIHTYSRSGSMREAKDIQTAIYTRLHRGAITVEGYALVDLMRETSDIMQMADGSFHGACEYRGLIETAS
ncbi:DUF3168 domain-containing protein [Neotabrizicola sp. sgz301269]|uniref:DUF3168 domain-containing protein n=1 Tax=Neotabrizicola sp. sgz301269 TaxID=3276282 RepID=UPI00376F5233